MTYYRYELEDWIGEERIYTNHSSGEWSTFIGNKYGARQHAIWDSEAKARAGHADVVSSQRQFKEAQQEIREAAPVLLDGTL